MPVTQSWNLILVPPSREGEIDKEYSLALNSAKQYLNQNCDALRKWVENPKQFAWYTLACDIVDRHLYYNTWVGDYYSEYSNLYLRPEFNKLFFKYFKFDGPGRSQGDFIFSEVMLTYGNTPADIFYQALGPVAIKRLQGFFGNFYIKANDIEKSIYDLQNILEIINWKDSVLRAAEWYGAPCNCVSENIEDVEGIIESYSKALSHALKEKCGLLGLVVTVG